MKLLPLVGLVATIEIKGREWEPEFHKKCFSKLNISKSQSGVKGWKWDDER